MPVHSVLLINPTGNVVYSKYFNDIRGSSEDNGNLIFEQLLHKHTSKAWGNKILLLPQTITINNIHIVFKKIGDLILFVSGTEEIDEIILLEMIDAFTSVLNDLSGGKLTAQELMNPENYGKWIISVDEVCPQGMLETTDPDLILKMSKLRSLF